MLVSSGVRVAAGCRYWAAALRSSVVVVLLALGCTDGPGEAFEVLRWDEPLPDRYVRDYPSNPGYGRADPPEGTFMDVSAGAYSTCGVRTGGELVCWGDRWGSLRPRRTVLPQGRFVRVDIWEGGGVRNGCAVAHDGSVACWSEGSAENRRGNQYGQADPPAGEFVDVSVAGRYACGLRADASVQCWGDNVGEEGYSYGWRGHDRHDFWPGGALDVPEGPFVEVHAGIPPCALRPTGELVCWGDATATWQSAATFSDPHWGGFPGAGAFGEPLVQVAPGWGFAHFWGPLYNRTSLLVCGLRPDFTLTCPGHNLGAREGIGRFSQVSHTSGPLCALRADRTLKCWVPSSMYWFGTILDVPAGEFVQVSAGAYHACAIRIGGTVACWGENSNKPLPPDPYD